MGKYTRNHFIYGRCSGLQFTENMFYSNKFINFLQRFFIVFYRCFVATICIAFMWPFALYYCMVEVNYIKNMFCKITFGIAGTLSCLNLILCSIPTAILIGFVFFLYWPLLDKILLMSDDYLGKVNND